LLKLGFQTDLLEPLAPKLPALCRVFFEPFSADYPFDLSQWQLSARAADILGEDRWNFRMAAPANLLFLLRAWHGLVFYLRGLGTPVLWNEVFDPIAERLRPEMDRLALGEQRIPGCEFSDFARHLKIRVVDHGVTKVALTSRASAIEDLESLLSEDLQAQIRARGIDLRQVVSNVRRRGYAPGPVFELREGQKTVDVLLA
jgi:hypothetical protein